MVYNVFPVLTEVELNLPIYLTSIGRWVHQDNITREQGFPDFQWIQCIDGEGCLEVDGRKYRVGRGQGMLLFPNESHHYYPISDIWAVTWITFNGKHLRDMMTALNFVRSEALYVTNPDMTLKRMYEVITLIETSDSMRMVDISALCYQLLLDLLKYSSATDIKSKQQHMDQLLPAIQLIEAQYSQSITLAEIAEQLKVTPQYACHLFQQSLGMRPFEYITKVRLRKAKEMLVQQPHRQVHEIGAQVGYEHPSYFIKVFKQHEGVTPSVFRSIHRE